MAGKATVLGFTVLQHGVTPAPWEQPTVHLTEVATGRTIEAAATSDGADGHFTATTTVPTSGFWTWTVTLHDLVAESPAATLPVWTAAGEPPILDPAMVFAAIDKVRRDVVNETTGTVFTESERLNEQIRLQGGITDAQRATIADLQTERDALTARIAALETRGAGDSVPLLGVLTLAVLAGATAGFLMAWLGGRPGPRDTALSPSAGTTPSPRGSSPG